MSNLKESYVDDQNTFEVVVTENLSSTWSQWSSNFCVLRVSVMLIFEPSTSQTGDVIIHRISSTNINYQTSEKDGAFTDDDER